MRNNLITINELQTVTKLTRHRYLISNGNSNIKLNKPVGD
jgi:hypothetical protein